jgi:hypothetical protein
MDKSNRLLRDTIRGILLEEGLDNKSLSLVAELQKINQRLKDLGARLQYGLNVYEGDIDMSIYFGRRSPDKRRPKLTSPELDWVSGHLDGAPPEIQQIIENAPWGQIDIAREPSVNGPCSSAWTVTRTHDTLKGWGPLLYDLAMELATAKGGGLAPDRNSVSTSANRIWTTYDGQRLGVDLVQLDAVGPDLKPDELTFGDQLSPEDPSDDCLQFSAHDDVGGARGKWRESPLSRAYKKPDGAVTKALKAAGLFWRDAL